MRCVFYDRDGVVNRSPGDGFVLNWEAFDLLPGFVATLRAATARGYAGVIVTNQSAVARGLISAESVEAIHDHLRDVLRGEHGLELLDVLYCPSRDDADPLRKPNPGMLLEAASRHGISLENSWMVGDQPRDIDAGRRAGCRTIAIGAAAADAGADVVCASMDELAAMIDDLLAC